MAAGAPPPIMGSLAGVAQLVEHHLAKVRVAGSSPVARSGKRPGQGPTGRPLTRVRTRPCSVCAANAQHESRKERGGGNEVAWTIVEGSVDTSLPRTLSTKCMAKRSVRVEVDRELRVLAKGDLIEMSDPVAVMSP
jgi:hypothetical protein